MRDLIDTSQHLNVALLNVQTDNDTPLIDNLAKIFKAAQLKIHSGDHILVKPNLLKMSKLATTDPQFVAACCKLLLDAGCKVRVFDSPGFGLAKGVANNIGLTACLKPLGLEVENSNKHVWRNLPLSNGQAKLPIATHALECDSIMSIPRLKVHSQMLLTLAVKNCFGVVDGLHKAVAHTFYGQDRDFFADVLAALYSILPPVMGVIDGRIAMHETGPGSGKPFSLNLIGACQEPVALDAVICTILNLKFTATPLGKALEKRKATGCPSSGCTYEFPLDTPKNFDCTGFILPKHLMTASFAPHRLIISCLRRLYYAFKSKLL